MTNILKGIFRLNNDDSEKEREEVFEKKIEILKKQIVIYSQEYKNYKLNVYKMSGKELVMLNPSLYKNQRLKEEEHINIISNGLLGKQLFHHNFILVLNTFKKNLEVYDGQHRIEALKKKSETVQSGVDCIVNIYQVYSDDDMYLQELYDEINIMKGNSNEERNIQKKS